MSMTPANALAFFASVIKSGEPWTPSCQQAYDEAMSHLAQPRAVTDGWETVKSDSLPPGYTLGHSKKDGGYWPLLKDGYIGTGWYATQAEAELVAWKHAHGKLDSCMQEIRRLAAALTEKVSEG